MKKRTKWIGLLLVLISVFSTIMIAHAGSLPTIPLNPSTSATTKPTTTKPSGPTKAPLVISDTTLKLTYKGDEPQLTANEPVLWSSSNTNVVKVDSIGQVHIIDRGDAVITATARDGRTATCKVTVRYTLVQWFIIIFLFGFIWYK